MYVRYISIIMFYIDQCMIVIKKVIKKIVWICDDFLNDFLCYIYVLFLSYIHIFMLYLSCIHILLQRCTTLFVDRNNQTNTTENMKALLIAAALVMCLVGVQANYGFNQVSRPTQV